MTTIGVDPGERWVGIVAATDGQLAWKYVLDRREVEDAVTAGTTSDAVLLDRWLSTVTGMLDVLLDDLADQVDPNSACPSPTCLVDELAVELTVAPRGHARGRDGHLIDPSPLIATAQVGGAVHGWAQARGLPVRFVTPDRHGTPDLPDGAPKALARQVLEQSYPPELVGARETTGRGKSPWQHMRAAWDIAETARRERRMTA